MYTKTDVQSWGIKQQKASQRCNITANLQTASKIDFTKYMLTKTHPVWKSSAAFLKHNTTDCQVQTAKHQILFVI